MSAIAFPQIFNSSGTGVVTERDETQQNLELLLMSEKGELFGDPAFGTNLRQIFFAQASDTTKELIASEISMAISTFMPQVRAPLNYIDFIINDTQLIVQLTLINVLDYTQDIYQIKLLQV